MTAKKRFNYTDATVAQIVEHFKKSSPQAIYNIRAAYSDSVVGAKIEEAYREYKRAELEKKLCAG